MIAIPVKETIQTTNATSMDKADQYPILNDKFFMVKGFDDERIKKVSVQSDFQIIIFLLVRPANKTEPE